MGEFGENGSDHLDLGIFGKVVITILE